MAMCITKRQNGADVTVPPFYIKDNGVNIIERDIVEAKRIGVDYSDEWKHKPWRFYIKDNPFVSVRAT